MNRLLKFIRYLNFKTLYFNFKYLPFNDAIKLPILISRFVNLKRLKGRIEFKVPIKTGLVRIGYSSVGIFDHKRSRSIWEVSGTIIFEGSAFIGQGSKISVGSGGMIIFGRNFAMSAESAIISEQRIQFGEDCLLSWDVLIMDTDFHNISDSEGVIINPPSPIIIGNHVWVGCRCLILKGTIISSGSIIAANSTVSATLGEENSIYAGSPSRVIKRNISWKR